MIRYPIEPERLRALVSACAPATGRHPGWLDRAAATTRQLRQRGAFEELPGAPSWSEIKPVFRSLQHHKCAYCERELPQEDYAGAEHDVEHYRPKGRTMAWPPASWPPKSGQPAPTFPFALVAGRAGGYPTLAYDVDNYATSCGTCNQALKHDAFPVERKASARTSTVAKLNEQERPYLPFPIGTWDVDPERLITFEGVRAVPADPRPGSRAHRRALVTIEFFQLNARGDLLRQRLRVMRSLLNELRGLHTASDPAVRKEHSDQVALLTAPSAPHASCARAYHRLFLSDPSQAYQLWSAGQANLDPDA